MSTSTFVAIGPTVTLTPSGGGASTTVVVAADGSFSFDPVPAGSYDLVASAPGFIFAVKLGLIVTNAPIALPPVELRGGLVDGDNVVSIRDISIVAASFGDVVVGRVDGQGRIVDINGNGVVDIMDISAVASNFGTVEPIDWP
ncbi:MAG: DUF2012 domain-containing protein [Chloroflexi bacterium]|nr:DUF2012 domain-containing protein [Chloroflexota bacterium]